MKTVYSGIASGELSLPIIYERRMIRKDGSILHALVSTGKITSPDTSDVSYTSFVIDITEHKQADDALRASEEKFSSILNSIDDVVWALSIRDSKLIYMSPSVEKLYGRTEEEFRRNKDLWGNAYTLMTGA